MSAASSKSETPERATLKLTVWQFVRLMVRLEETAKSSEMRKALFDLLKADWRVMDAELERLREQDFDSFSRMMMDHTVRFDDLPARALVVAGQVLNEVAGHIGRAAQSAQGDGRAELEYERRELQALVRKLAPKLRTGGKKPVGTARARKPEKKVGAGTKRKARAKPETGAADGASGDRKPRRGAGRQKRPGDAH